MPHPRRQPLLFTIFVIFFFLLHFPLLSIANRPFTLGGIPGLYWYIFGTWLLMIGLLGILLERKRFKR